MSNAVYEFPAMPGVAMSAGQGAAIIESRAQTEQVLEVGRAFEALFRSFWNMLGRIDTAFRSARAMNDLFNMSDRALADIGIARSDIPSVIGSSDFDSGIETAVTRYVYSVSDKGLRERHLAA